MNKFHNLVFISNKIKYQNGKEVDKFIIGDYELEFAKHDTSKYINVFIKCKKIGKEK